MLTPSAPHLPHPLQHPHRCGTQDGMVPQRTDARHSGMPTITPPVHVPSPTHPLTPPTCSCTLSPPVYAPSHPFARRIAPHLDAHPNRWCTILTLLCTIPTLLCAIPTCFHAYALSTCHLCRPTCTDPIHLLHFALCATHPLIQLG